MFGQQSKTISTSATNNLQIQEKKGLQLDHTTDTIAFILTKYNNITIRSILNERDTVNLMFHTAASHVSLTQTATQRIKSLRLDKLYTGVKSWGGTNGTSRSSENNSLRIGKLTWDNIAIDENELSGHTTDGKFGPNLFRNKIIEINFDTQIILIRTQLPTIGEDYEKFDLILKNNYMYIKGLLDVGETNKYSAEFLIHSGYSGTILLDDKFVDAHNIASKLKIISESQLKDAQGNVLKTKKAILPNLVIGTINFPEMPISFFEGAIGRQKMSVLGGDLLKRFHIIIDIKNAAIYLKPNSLMKTPYTDI